MREISEKDVKADIVIENLGQQLRKVNDELLVQRGQPIFQGTSQRELDDATQECEKKEGTITTMKAAVKILEGRLEAAEVDESKVKELQETVERMDTDARQKNLVIETAEERQRVLVEENIRLEAKVSSQESSC